jgi:hypothetical protein
MVPANGGGDERPVGFREDPMLVLHYTAFCNAKCAHCIVDSGPQRTERMSMRLAGELIDGAEDVPRLRTVVFSGGESFVYLEDVLQLCARARERGMQTRIISNAFWARSPQAAAAVIERLVDRCVDQLVVSFGDFHREYIPAARVRNVFLGAQRASRAPLIVYSTVNASRVEDDEVMQAGECAWPSRVLRSILAYGFSPDECVPLRVAVQRAGELTGEERARFKRAMVHERALVNWESVGLGGRASRLLGGQIPLDPIDDCVGPQCSAVGRQVTSTTGGHVYPCCSVWTSYPAHAFGVAKTAADLGRLVGDMNRDALVRFIHERGPGPLLTELRRTGARLPDAYSDICHMCQTLFEHYSPEQLRAAVVAAEAYHAAAASGR